MLMRFWNWVSTVDPSQELGFTHSLPKTSWGIFGKELLRFLVQATMLIAVVGFPLFLVGAGWRSLF